MMKNYLYFNLKRFLFLRYINFCPDFFGHVGKRLDKEAEINFKIYDVINWKKKIAMHILPNILRSRGNQTMKVGQLIEYKRRNIFPQNHAENKEVRLFPQPFLIFKKLLYELKVSFPLREKCLNTELFLVTDQEKFRIWTLFTQCSAP